MPFSFRPDSKTETLSRRVAAPGHRSVVYVSGGNVEVRQSECSE